MATRIASSVRTTRPRPPPPKTSGACNKADSRVVKLLSSPWDELPVTRNEADAPTGSASGRGGGVADDGWARGPSFSFPEIEAPASVDGEEGISAFATPEEATKAKAAVEFLVATFGPNTGTRTEAIKKNLLVDRMVLDLAGPERRSEATAELEGFTEEEAPSKAPPKDSELHGGTDARRRWIGPAAVPEFFICPISKKVLKNPVVISSGKLIDGSGTALVPRLPHHSPAQGSPFKALPLLRKSSTRGVQKRVVRAENAIIITTRAKKKLESELSKCGSTCDNDKKRNQDTRLAEAGEHRTHYQVSQSRNKES